MADNYLPTNNMNNYQSILSGITPKTGFASSSIIDSILNGLGASRSTKPQDQGDNWADIGSAISALGSGEKANRLSGANLYQNYDQMMLGNELAKNQLGLQTQQSRNENEADALRKLQQTSYLGGATGYTPATISLGGRNVTLADFGFGPKAATDAEKQGASSLQGQVLSRLMPGGSFTPTFNYTPTPVNEYAKPGTLEKIASYGGAGTSILGLLGNTGILSKIPGIGGLLGGTAATGEAAGNIGGVVGAGSKLGGSAISGILGKALPIAGAVTGGLGLIKDRGLGGNIANGAMAGASLGSIVPGLGTAIGGAIGAGIGGLRSLANIGGPSQEELAGRDAASQGRSAITAMATPQQRAEAQSAGWEKPEQALTLIVLRDQLAQHGGSPELANQFATQLWQAEKQGPQAVQQVMNSIQGAMSRGY